jgi:hypothetical protein
MVQCDCIQNTGDQARLNDQHQQQQILLGCSWRTVMRPMPATATVAVTAAAAAAPTMVMTPRDAAAPFAHRGVDMCHVMCMASNACVGVSVCHELLIAVVHNNEGGVAAVCVCMLRYVHYRQRASPYKRGLVFGLMDWGVIELPTP